LAAAAQVQGDVLISGGTVVSGPPLLREAARRGVDLLNFRDQNAVQFHFILIDVVLSTRTIKKGDALDRMFLRILRIPVTKNIQECGENPASAPANRLDSTKNPIEVWVYGKARCLQTQTSYTGTLNWS
jgi:hypothetical protein